MLIKSLGVITGYAIFVASSLALFKFSGVNPHAGVTTGFMVLTTVFGIFFSALAGIVTQKISGGDSPQVNYILAVIIAAFATFSLFKASGTHWTQLLAIFLFAPVSLIAGIVFIKLKK